MGAEKAGEGAAKAGCGGVWRHAEMEGKHKKMKNARILYCQDEKNRVECPAF